MRLLLPIAEFSLPRLLLRTVVGIVLGVMLAVPICAVVRVFYYWIDRSASAAAGELQDLLTDHGDFIDFFEHPYSVAGYWVGGAIGGMIGVLYYCIFRHRQKITVDKEG